MVQITQITSTEFFSQFSDIKESFKTHLQPQEQAKEIERLKGLNRALFVLWENLADAGEISIGKDFNATYLRMQTQLTNQ